MACYRRVAGGGIAMGRGAETRERIVQESRSLFAEKGYDGTTTAEIARRAAISEGAIYRHFKDKKELFIGCVAPAIEEAFERSLDEVRETKDLREMVRNILEIRLDMLIEYREAFDILFAESPHHPELKELLEDRIQSQLSEVPLAFQSVQESGKLRRKPNLLFLGLGLTVGMWAILNFRRERDGVKEWLGITLEKDALLDELTDFVLLGIAGETGGDK
jgi:AcrR family transcriptional regulator